MDFLRPGMDFLRPGLKTGMGNGIFRSEIGSGFEDAGGTPPPKISTSTPSPPGGHSRPWVDLRGQKEILLTLKIVYNGIMAQWRKNNDFNIKVIFKGAQSQYFKLLGPVLNCLKIEET